ncbi:MAG: carbon storage regulator [Pirellulales bacterium]
MLVLTRKKDEVICIGDGVEVMVVEVRGDKVRLGIKADSSVPIHRKEVKERIENGEALRKERV